MIQRMTGRVFSELNKSVPKTMVTIIMTATAHQRFTHGVEDKCGISEKATRPGVTGLDSYYA